MSRQRPHSLLLTTISWNEIFLKIYMKWQLMQHSLCHCNRCGDPRLQVYCYSKKLLPRIFCHCSDYQSLTRSAHADINNEFLNVIPSKMSMKLTVNVKAIAGIIKCWVSNSQRLHLLHLLHCLLFALTSKNEAELCNYMFVLDNNWSKLVTSETRRSSRCRFPIWILVEQFEIYWVHSQWW